MQGRRNGLFGLGRSNGLRIAGKERVFLSQATSADQGASGKKPSDKVCHIGQGSELVSDDQNPTFPVRRSWAHGIHMRANRSAHGFGLADFGSEVSSDIAVRGPGSEARVDVV
jgi:hypothetical protein